MAQRHNGTLRAWTEDTKFSKGALSRIRPSKNITKSSPVAVNPAFDRSLDNAKLEDTFQIMQMKPAPSKFGRLKDETDKKKTGHWNEKERKEPRKISAPLSRIILALMGITCLISVLALLLTLLMFFGEMEVTKCHCSGQKGETPNTSALEADQENMSDKVTSLQTKVNELEGKLDDQKANIARQEDTITALQQEIQQGRQRIDAQEKMLNESTKDKFQQTTSLLALEAALNSTRQEVEELKQVWEIVNATKEDLEKNVWDALNKTEEKLEQLNRVWIDVNSTIEDVQQLNETFQNVTTEIQYRFSDVWNNVSSAQQCCSHLTSSLGMMADKLNVTDQKLQDSKQILLDRLTSVNATLTNQMNNISKMPGPIGPPGYNGSQGLNGSQGPAGPTGPKGAGDFSQCQYKFVESIPTSAGSMARNDKIVVEPSDKRIVGATCSTDNAEEYRLSSDIYTSGPNAGKRFYKCKCAGQAGIMKDGGGKMKCVVHYWECPKP